MRRAILFSLLFLFSTIMVSGEIFDQDFFLQKRQAREARREALKEKYSGMHRISSGLAQGQEDFDVIYYELNLNLDPDTETITGTVTIRANSLITNLNQAIIDLFNDMTVSSVTGNASGYIHADDLITIDLDGSYGIGETFEVSIVYSGQPLEYNGLGFHFNTSGGLPAISNDSYPYYARSWWPCKDDPADKADSVDMIFTVPDELTVVCNGALRDVTDNLDGTKTFHWHEGYPISTYLICIAAADYVTFSDWYQPAVGDLMEIRYYVFPADLNDAMEDFNIDVEAMEFYVSIYGEYPFIEEKYGIAECASAFAGMEYQTITFYGSYFITGTHEYDDIVVHELSHMWWGDMVTNENWHSTWLNEGFASYSEALWFEHVGGSDAYHQYMDVTLNSLGFTNPIYRYETSDPFGILEGEVYDKGAWVLHMLRGMVGFETLIDILAEYRNQYEFGTVTTEDFQAVCEQVSGMDLSWFFQQWIYEPWHPEYYWGWQVEGMAGSDFIISGFIDQVQEDGPIFTMPLDLGIVTVGGDTLYETVFVDEQFKPFQLTVGEEPVDVLLDPLNWVLKEASGVTDPVMHYTNHRIEDNGDGDGRPDPGETVEMTVEIVNSGVNAMELFVALSTDDPDVSITGGWVEYGSVIHGEATENSQTPFTFSVDPAAETHLTKFELTFTGQGGYVGVDSFYLTIGTPVVLLVDDDGGDEYEQIYQQALATHAVPFQAWRSSQEGSPGDTLTGFDIIVWFTGRARENTLTQTDQAAISAFLDNGGRLFLSGQDIGYDLVEMGSGETFFSDYLHADFVTDVSPEGFLKGVSGDPITGAYTLLTVGSAMESPDVVAPLGGASVTLEYSPSEAAAGIKYGNDYRLVYFTVGLEGIEVLTGNSDAMRTSIMGNIINWLQFVATKGDVNEDGRVDILDVIWAVNILLGIVTPTPSQEWAADFNDDGGVNVLDAIGIVNEILGPVGFKNPAPEVNNLSHVSIEIETDVSLSGAQIELTFDPVYCIPYRPQSDDQIEGMNIATVTDDGKMVILLYSLDQSVMIGKPGITFTLPVDNTQSSSMPSALWISDWTLADVKGEEVSGKVRLTGSEDVYALPDGFELSQNYPNPFNPETEIRFAVPPREGDHSVILTVYNLLGQKVRILVHGRRDAGYYTVRWDGLNNEGQPVASGLYYYILQVGQFKAMKRMIMLK